MRHRIPRRNLAPADRQIPFKGDEPRRRSGIDDRAEGLLVFVAIPFPVLGTNPPIHAPAAIAGPARSKQALESRPEIRSQRPHVQIERACSLAFAVHQSRLPRDLSFALSTWVVVPAARGETPAVFGRRGIPADCVAPP